MTATSGSNFCQSIVRAKHGYVLHFSAIESLKMKSLTYFEFIRRDTTFTICIFLDYKTRKNLLPLTAKISKANVAGW